MAGPQTPADILNFLDDLLENFDVGWGTPFSWEHQYLLLIDLYWFVETGLRGVSATRLWSGILNSQGYIGNWPLAHQTDLQDDEDKAFEELVRLMPLLRNYIPRECSDCNGTGYKEWLTGCPACGQTPPCEEPEEGDCAGPEGESQCKTCHSKGHTFEERE